MKNYPAFDEFVRTRSHKLFRVAFLLCRDRMLAEDLLQTALVRAWTVWARVDGDPEPYVRRILINTYSSWWRRRWRGEVPYAELPEPDPVRPQDDTDDRDLVLRALGRLPRQQRAVLVLRYFEDLSEAQIANAMSISPGAVKNYASKALAKLRTDPSLSALPELAPSKEPQIPAGSGRLAGVHERLRTRRKRIVTVTAAATLMLILVSAYLLSPLARDRKPPVTPSPSPSSAPAGTFEEGMQIGAEIPQTPFSSPSTTVTWVPVAGRTIWLSFSCLTQKGAQYQVVLKFPGFEQGWACDTPDLPPQPRGWGSGTGFNPEAMGLEPGKPVTVTVFVRENNGTGPLPPSGAYAAAIAQEVPFQQYPLPSAPTVLEPLTRSPRPASLRLEANGAHQLQLTWTGQPTLRARSQTPGLLWITVNGKPLEKPLSFWRYNITSDQNSLLRWPSGIAEPAIGSMWTITVEPQYLTGDWFVDVQPGTPGG